MKKTHWWMETCLELPGPNAGRMTERRIVSTTMEQGSEQQDKDEPWLVACNEPRLDLASLTFSSAESSLRGDQTPRPFPDPFAHRRTERPCRGEDEPTNTHDPFPPANSPLRALDLPLLKI